MTQFKTRFDLPPLVERAVQRLIRAFRPERIVLFGSYAKNRVRQDSDVDLLVIANLRGDSFSHQRRARQLASDCFPRVDIVLAAPEDIAGAPTAKSLFLHSILGTGITIYHRNDSG
ncbi:MAG TPA: nucleotidyltransferase domain-containing protein [Candidatus Angelobacter sp.]|nr:nucleotidyltransferase domain-containing protein [Candidatus Angelobacter sp.]